MVLLLHLVTIMLVKCAPPERELLLGAVDLCYSGL